MYYQIYFNCVQTIHGLAIAKKVMEKSIMFDGVSINAVIPACLHCSPLEHVIYPMSEHIKVVKNYGARNATKFIGDV